MVLIILLLLNVWGYYGVFLGLQVQNNREMVQRLDEENYINSETMVIKVPLSVPYGSGSQEFQRVQGQFEFKGEYFQLVKQKLQGDTLLIVCIKDQQSKVLHQALASYVKTFTDKPVDCPAGVKILSSLSIDYFSPDFELYHSALGWEQKAVKEVTLPKITSSYCPSIVHPPQRFGMA